VRLGLNRLRGLPEALEPGDTRLHRPAARRRAGRLRSSPAWPSSGRSDPQDRELEGRPCLTINRLPSFIRQVVNDARQNKPSINVHPVDSHADPRRPRSSTA
jgi:hypothetical protein